MAYGWLNFSGERDNAMIERFFRSLKQDCTWQHAFRGLREANATVARWIRWYNEERTHQALDYRSPLAYRAQQSTAVA